MNDTDLSSLRSFVQRLRATHWRGALGLAAVRLGWLALVASAALMALDAIFPLPAAGRETLRWTTLAALLGGAALTWLRESRAQSIDRHVVRQMERGNASVQNDLINALEFSDRLDTAQGEPPVTAGLMRRAINRALEEITSIRDWSPLRPHNLRREWYMLLLTLAVAGLSVLPFGGVYRAVLPRYLEPYADHPPYCPTHIRVDPSGARVDYGGQLPVKVWTSGTPAREASLVLENEAGRTLQALAMFQTEKGQFAQTIENIRQPMRYYIAVPGGRSHRLVLALNKIPHIESVGLKLTPPAYIHKPQMERLLDQPVIKGYAKSRARLTFVSNRPLASGEIRLALGGKTGEQVIALRSDGANAVSGEFDLLKPCKMTARVTDEEGLVSQANWSGSIEIMPDEKPTITVTSPGMDSFAIPDTQLPIVIEANDDLGLRNITLLREINGSRDFRKVMIEGDGSENFLHAVETLNLADLGVRGGDIISYYATTTDSNPDAPHTAATPAYRLAIISFEEYRKYLQTQMTAKDLAAKYEEYRARLEDLAKEQDALRKETEELEKKMAWEGGLSKADQEALAEKQSRQDDLAGKTGALAEDLRREAAKAPIFDIEKDFKRDLSQISERLGDAVKNMKSAKEDMDRAGKSKQPESQEDLKKGTQDQQEALNNLRRNASAYAAGVNAASKELKATMDLIGDVEQFKDLYRRQKELERQARLFKDSNNPSRDDRVRMKELAEDETGIRQQIEQLVPALRAHAAEIEADVPKVAEDARNIANEIERRQITASMGWAETRLNEADGPGGHPSAAEALKQMEAMISFCEAKSGKGGECETRLQIQMGGRNMSMGDTLDQLRASLSAGMGRMGMGGEAGDGSFGAATQVGLFGSEQFGDPTRESRIVGARVKGAAVAAPESAASVATIEELSPTNDAGHKVTVKSGERMMDEYRTLIEAYFRGLAEEK